MKTLSMVRENAMPNINGVANHLTPIKNIITNINNLFVPYLNVVATPGGDNVSIIVKSSYFTDEETTRQHIYYPVSGNCTLAGYVARQGLNNIKIIPSPLGCIVMFCPSDMPQMGYSGDLTCGDEPKCACEALKGLGDVEYDSFLYEEGEDNPNMNGLKNYGFGDQEIEDIQKKDLRELLGSKDKVKAAKAFAAILAQNMRMPENYYIKAVRDEDGNESVALRYRYEKRKPFGKTATMTKTLVNIYNTDENGIWVDGADDPNGLPEEMKGVIDDMLGFIGVRRTGDACCFSVAMNDDGDDLKADPNDINSKDNEGQDNSEGENDNDDADAQQKKDDDNKTTMDNTPSNSESGFSRNDGMTM